MDLIQTGLLGGFRKIGHRGIEVAQLEWVIDNKTMRLQLRLQTNHQANPKVVVSHKAPLLLAVGGCSGAMDKAAGGQEVPTVSIEVFRVLRNRAPHSLHCPNHSHAFHTIGSLPCFALRTSAHGYLLKEIRLLALVLLDPSRAKSEWHVSDQHKSGFGLSQIVMLVAAISMVRPLA